MRRDLDPKVLVLQFNASKSEYCNGKIFHLGWCSNKPVMNMLVDEKIERDLVEVRGILLPLDTVR